MDGRSKSTIATRKSQCPGVSAQRDIAPPAQKIVYTSADFGRERHRPVALEQNREILSRKKGYRSGKTDDEDASGAPGTSSKNDEIGEIGDVVDSLIKVTVSNLDQVDYSKLLDEMSKRFQYKVKKWESMAYSYARFAFALNITILILSLFQTAFTQAASMSGIATTHILTVNTVITALTALIIALQLKLKLTEKAEKYRKGAKAYAKLSRISTYYTMIIQNGGKIDDVINLWRNAMKRETHWIPFPRTYVPV